MILFIYVDVQMKLMIFLKVSFKWYLEPRSSDKLYHFGFLFMNMGKSSLWHKCYVLWSLDCFFLKSLASLSVIDVLREGLKIEHMVK